MREDFAMPQPGTLVQRLLDIRIRVEHTLTGKQFHGVEEVTSGPDGCVDVEPVLHAGQIVVRAMTGRGVDRARTGVEGDIVGEHADRVPLVQRVTEADPFELLALHAGDRWAERTFDSLAHTVGELLRDDDGTAAD